MPGWGECWAYNPWDVARALPSCLQVVDGLVDKGKSACAPVLAQLFLPPWDMSLSSPHLKFRGPAKASSFFLLLFISNTFQGL